MTKRFNEERLKKGLRTGDSKVLDEIYQQYFERTAYWVSQNRGTREDARDIFQEALTAIYLQLRNPDFHIKHELGTYLHAICRNLWLKILRDDVQAMQSSAAKLPQLTSEETVDISALITKEQLYRDQFLKLGKQCQEIMRLFLQGISMQAIAQQLKLSSVNYVKKRKFLCKEQLINAIKKDPRYKLLRDE